MLVIHKGFEYNVTNESTLAQLLKYGAVAVGETIEATEEVKIVEKEEKKPSSRKK